MLKAIPWNIIGPAATVAIVILVVVFWFMLKWKKLEKPAPAPLNPPRSINDTHKKSLCFAHEGRISSNETAIEMVCEQLGTANENNRKDHKDMFEKIETLGKDIITEIHRANGDT